MKDYVATYKVVISTEDINKGKPFEECGLLSVNSFEEAFQDLVMLYSDDIVQVKDIELFETTITFPTDKYEEVKRFLGTH